MGSNPTLCVQKPSKIKGLRIFTCILFKHFAYLIFEENGLNKGKLLKTTGMQGYAKTSGNVENTRERRAE